MHYAALNRRLKSGGYKGKISFNFPYGMSAMEFAHLEFIKWVYQPSFGQLWVIVTVRCAVLLQCAFLGKIKVIIIITIEL